jgi:hypothetical protein
MALRRVAVVPCCEAWRAAAAGERVGVVGPAERCERMRIDGYRELGVTSEAEGGREGAGEGEMRGGVEG